MNEQNEVDEKLRDFLNASAHLFDAAQRAYRAERPDDHAAFCTLMEQGGAKPYVTATMPPAVGVEIGMEYEGRREAFFSWPGSTGLRPN